jgi:hypothetical protein
MWKTIDVERLGGYTVTFLNSKLWDFGASRNIL